MDRRAGLAACAIVLTLTGCGCARDRADSEKGMSEYFTGCWQELNSKREREQRAYQKEKEAVVQNRLDDIKKKNEIEDK